MTPRVLCCGLVLMAVPLACVGDGASSRERLRASVGAQVGKTDWPCPPACADGYACIDSIFPELRSCHPVCSRDEECPVRTVCHAIENVDYGACLGSDEINPNKDPVQLYEAPGLDTLPRAY